MTTASDINALVRRRQQRRENAFLFATPITSVLTPERTLLFPSTTLERERVRPELLSPFVEEKPGLLATIGGIPIGLQVGTFLGLKNDFLRFAVDVIVDPTILLAPLALTKIGKAKKLLDAMKIGKFGQSAERVGVAARKILRLNKYQDTINTGIKAGGVTADRARALDTIIREMAETTAQRKVAAKGVIAEQALLEAGEVAITKPAATFAKAGLATERALVRAEIPFTDIGITLIKAPKVVAAVGEAGAAVARTRIGRGFLGLFRRAGQASAAAKATEEIVKNFNVLEETFTDLGKAVKATAVEKSRTAFEGASKELFKGMKRADQDALLESIFNSVETAGRQGIDPGLLAKSTAEDAGILANTIARETTNLNKLSLEIERSVDLAARNFINPGEVIDLLPGVHRVRDEQGDHPGRLARLLDRRQLVYGFSPIVGADKVPARDQILGRLVRIIRVLEDEPDGRQVLRIHVEGAHRFFDVAIKVWISIVDEDPVDVGENDYRAPFVVLDLRHRRQQLRRREQGPLTRSRQDHGLIEDGPILYQQPRPVVDKAHNLVTGSFDAFPAAGARCLPPPVVDGVNRVLV